MTRLLWRLFLIALCGTALVWLADRPGTITITWLGQEIELSVLVGFSLFVAAFAAALFVFWLLRKIWTAPAAIGAGRRARRTRRAYESLSHGIIAAGAGDAAAAQRHAAIAAETLKDEPLVHLLGAQAAQLRGDREGVKNVFENMAAKPATELLGLRGLYAHARETGDWHAARKHAEAAHGKNSKLPWASHAMLQSHIAHKDWLSAARVVGQQARAGIIEREVGTHRQAAMLTAAALALEEKDKAKALELAGEAHKLDAGLVPAAALMARLQIAAGHARKAAKVLKATWEKSPHRELASLQAWLADDSAEAQFERVRELTGQAPASEEGRYALARAAIQARRFDAAREVLKPALEASPSSGICALMAEIEDGSGHQAEARHWLARALHAPRDPMWVSDGVAAAHWVPVSPVTSEIVPCTWRVPFETAAPAALPPAAATAQPVAPAASSTAKPQAATALPPPPDDPGVAEAES